MNTKLTDFSFDVDGTILDHNGNIRSGAVDLFKAIQVKYPNANINIISQLPYQTAKKMVDEINHELDRSNRPPIEPNYACLSGALFVLKDGTTYTEAHIPSDFVRGSIKIAKSRDPMVTPYLNIYDNIAVMTRENYDGKDAKLDYHMTTQSRSEFRSDSWIKRNFYDPVIELMKNKVQPDFPTEAVSKKQFEQDLYRENVRSIQMSSISRPITREIVQDLEAYAKEYNNEYGTDIKIIPGGSAIEICNPGKTASYIQLAGTPNSQHFYVGDGNNDCEILRQVAKSGGCAVGFRRMPAAISGNYTATNFEQIAKIIEHDEYGFAPEEYTSSKDALEEIQNKGNSKLLGAISAIHTLPARAIAEVRNPSADSTVSLPNDDFIMRDGQ